MNPQKIKDSLIKYFNDIPLSKKLILSFSMLIVAVFSVGIISAFFSQKYLIESEQAYTIQSMDQLNRSLDSFFEIYMDRTNLVFMSDEMQQIMDTEVTNIEEAVLIDQKIRYLCGYIKNNTKYPEMKNSNYYGGNVTYKLFIDNDTLNNFGSQIQPLENIENEKWYKQFSSEARTFKWQSTQVIDGTSYISLSRRLIRFSDSKLRGILQVFIPREKIEEVIASNIRDQVDTVFYMDDSFNCIAKVGINSQYLNSIVKLNLSSGINQISIDNNKYLAGRLRSNTTGWEIIYLVPLQQITKKTNLLELITGISVIISLILCITIAYFVASIITRRIKVLVKKANMIGDNNLKTNLTLQGNDELGQLNRQFDKMVLRINNLIEEEYESEITINKIKLELLQEQINPHLLYNTLAMVSHTAKREGKYEIMEITDKLSNFYRGILSKGKTICSFKEEIDMLKTYIDLIRYVYSIDVDVIFDIDEKIYDLYTIKLLLQPVVENSLIHGIKPKKTGTLVISAYIEDNLIQVLVSDDGIGMNKDAVDELNNITSYKDITKGYGVSNVIKRIKLFFGNQYGATIKSVSGEGTSIMMTLPAVSRTDIEALAPKKIIG